MTVRDPVCGMEIEPQGAFVKREHMGQTFYFCSQSCVSKFDADPHKYGHPQEHDHDKGHGAHS
ncbi:MAG TPA: YHS domain-containing protein [Anaerolineales bacterium]|nr:YHS domain-containing protein [Anaerolineales bacterium]